MSTPAGPHRRTHAAGPAALAALAASCGASLLVLRRAGDAFGLVALVVLQAAVALAFLRSWLRAASHRRLLRRRAGALAGLSLLSATLPFVLAAPTAAGGGAGALAVAYASGPVAAVLAGALWLGARAGALPFAGFVVGLAGVLLLQWQGIALQLSPSLAGAGAGAAAWPASATLGLAAAAAAASCSVLAAWPARTRPGAADAVALVVAAQGGSALILLPPAAWLWPGAGAGAPAWGLWAGLLTAAAGLGVALGERLARQAGGADQAPGPQSRQRSTGGGPMRSARCSSRSALRRPSSITGW